MSIICMAPLASRTAKQRRRMELINVLICCLGIWFHSSTRKKNADHPGSVTDVANGDTCCMTSGIVLLKDLTFLLTLDYGTTTEDRISSQYCCPVMFPVLVLLFVALWFILRGDLFYVLPCVILLLFFRLRKRKLILVLFVRLFDLCLFEFIGFLFLLVSGKGCDLWLWHSLDFSLTFFSPIDDDELRAAVEWYTAPYNDTSTTKAIDYVSRRRKKTFFRRR